MDTQYIYLSLCSHLPRNCWIRCGMQFVSSSRQHTGREPHLTVSRSSKKHCQTSRACLLGCQSKLKDVGRTPWLVAPRSNEATKVSGLQALQTGRMASVLPLFQPFVSKSSPSLLVHPSKPLSVGPTHCPLSLDDRVPLSVNHAPRGVHMMRVHVFGGKTAAW